MHWLQYLHHAPEFQLHTNKDKVILCTNPDSRPIIFEPIFQKHMRRRRFKDQDGIFLAHSIPDFRHHSDLPLGRRNTHGNAWYGYDHITMNCYMTSSYNVWLRRMRLGRVPHQRLLRELCRLLPKAAWLSDWTNQKYSLPPEQKDKATCLY